MIGIDEKYSDMVNPVAADVDQKYITDMVQKLIKTSRDDIGTQIRSIGNDMKGQITEARESLDEEINDIKKIGDENNYKTDQKITTNENIFNMLNNKISE